MEKEQLILHSAQEFNILPLTSYCGGKCIFCSHKSNPPQVRVAAIPPRTMEEVERTLAFLDGSKKIIIGESATTIIEGEPFSHPCFSQVLELIRGRFPHTMISLTTNGHYIDEKTISLLRAAQPVEINVSLNSATVRGRKILMGDDEARAKKAIKGIRLLHEEGLPYHGSIVAMPHILGWDDLAGTVSFLADQGALTIRIFMAGYAQNADPGLKFDPDLMHRDLKEFVAGMAEKTACPILLEPPPVADLKPVVAGVIKGSNAYRAGVQRGDLIVDINGRVPRSRVEAWQWAQEPGLLRVKIKRQGQPGELVWHNQKDEKSGLVMEFDFDMKRWDRIAGKVRGATGPVLLLCSRLAEKVLERLAKSGERPDIFRIQPVQNYLFGGSIGAAGLLSVDDFYSAYLAYRREHPRPALILLPGEAFNYLGRDLTGKSYQDLEEKTGVKVLVV